jgi:hypothetical protein
MTTVLILLRSHAEALLSRSPRHQARLASHGGSSIPTELLVTLGGDCLANVSRMRAKDAAEIAARRAYADGHHWGQRARLLSQAERWEKDARQVESDGERIASSQALLAKADAALGL